MWSLFLTALIISAQQFTYLTSHVKLLSHALLIHFFFFSEWLNPVSNGLKANNSDYETLFDIKTQTEQVFFDIWKWFSAISLPHLIAKLIDEISYLRVQTFLSNHRQHRWFKRWDNKYQHENKGAQTGSRMVRQKNR